MPDTLLFRRIPLMAFATAASLIGAATLGAQSQTKQAKDTTADTATRTRSLDKMVVTATRASTVARDVPQKVVVIDRKDIEQTPVMDVTEILKRLAAVDVVQYPSLLSGISIRGFRPETGGLNMRMQVLIDGRFAGSGNLGTFPLDNIERIEVVKGATSALYGAGGMSGTVNIITRKSRGSIRANVNALYGSYQTSNFSGHVGGALPAGFDFDLSGNHYHMGDDYKIGKGGILRGAFGSKSALRLYADSAAPVRTRDLGDGTLKTGSRFGYQNGAGRIGYAFNSNTRVDVSGEIFKANRVRTPGDLLFNGTNNGLKDMDRNALDVTFSSAHGRHVPRVRFYTGYEDSDTYNDTTGPNNFVNFAGQTRTRGIQAQDVIHLGRHTLTTGIDYLYAKATSNRRSDPTTPVAPFSANSQNTSVGVFVQNHWRALGDRLTGTIGGRIDRIALDLLRTPLLTSAIAGKHNFTTFNPSAGIQYRTTEDVRFHASVGRAFIVPAAGNMAGQSITGTGSVTVTAGNPDLKPESSVTFDVGAGYAPLGSGFEMDLTYFHTRISNRITSAFASFEDGSEPFLPNGDTVASAQTYVNANHAIMQGFEAALSYDFGVLFGSKYVLRAFSTATRLFSAYDYTRSVTANSAEFAGVTDFDAADVRDAITFGTLAKNRVRNVTPLTVTTGIEYNSLGRWNGRLTGRYVARRLDRDFSVSPNVDILYAPFAVLDAVFGMSVTPNYRVEALINNLTDENYYEKRGYNLPGRAVQLRVSITR